MTRDFVGFLCILIKYKKKLNNIFCHSYEQNELFTFYEFVSNREENNEELLRNLIYHNE